MINYVLNILLLRNHYNKRFHYNINPPLIYIYIYRELSFEKSFCLRLSFKPFSSSPNVQMKIETPLCEADFYKKKNIVLMLGRPTYG